MTDKTTIGRRNSTKLADVSATPFNIQALSTDTSNVFSVEEVKRAKMLADISLKLNGHRPNIVELIEHERYCQISDN